MVYVRYQNRSENYLTVSIELLKFAMISSECKQLNQSAKIQYKYATLSYNLKLTPQLLITTLNVFAFLWCVAKWRMVVYLVSTPPGEKGILT